jgi:hypothetical protein
MLEYGRQWDELEHTEHKSNHNSNSGNSNNSNDSNNSGNNSNNTRGDMFDSVHSDGRSLLAFIIESLAPEVVAHYVPLGALPALLEHAADATLKGCRAFLQFDAGHVWARVRTRAGWWHLDSQEGRARFLNTGGSPFGAYTQQYGYVLVMPLDYALVTLPPVFKKRLALAARAAQLDSRESVKEWAARGSTLLGDLEVPLFAYLHVLERCSGGALPPALLPLARAARSHFRRAAADADGKLALLLPLVANILGHPS